MKMLIKCNLLESLTFISCFGTVICILLNYVTNISPITGIWFPIYVLVLFFASATFSFRLIRWLMDLNKPLKYDVDGFVKNYPYLSILCDFLPRVPKVVAKECKEYDINDLSVISTVLERRLVSSWYFPYVSEEIGFPFACKQLLDQMISKTFQVCHNIDTKDIYIDTCSVLITHLKEYKKALKRHEKSPESSIESLYKKCHRVSNGDKKTASGEHCTDLLRVILKELVPWELWDTPQLELLVRILAKKLDSFIETTLTDPVWINDKLMTLLLSKPAEVAKEKITEETSIEVLEAELKQEATIAETKENDVTKAESLPPAKSEVTTIESALSSVVTKTTAPILQRALEEINNHEIEKMDQVEELTIASEPVDIKSSPVLRQRRGRQGRNEVKIYDRIIEGSVKTWETDTDLQCISLGQDLLASLNGEITLSRLWGQEQDSDNGNRDNRLWFGEDETLDMELGSKETSPVKKEQSPKPTDALLKDIQSTVHQAKSKIGDLQVPHVVSVNDEAAGMMEGLLDFGIAGLKKGLKFTGLSDDSQEKSPSNKEKSCEKSPPPDSKHKHEHKDFNSSTVLREENGISIVPPLVKQHRVSSQDSVATLPKPMLGSEFPSSLDPVSSSPEPEYEEAADLSTSIAKLRCLLQQRAHSHSNTNEHSNRSEDMWWEGGVETRGHHQVQRTSRQVDSAVMADEYDMQADRGLVTSPEQTTNNMQRLDKLFHRTVTGVFNSLKTAVGGDEMAAANHTNWTYIHSAMEGSVCARVTRLVCARRGGRVDAALDSLLQLNAEPAPTKALEPADFEEWCSQCGGAWCAGSELAAAAGLARAHLAYRIATLILADLAESFISVYLDCMSEWLRQQIFSMFSNMAQQDSMHTHQPRNFDEEETCTAIVDRIPCIQVFGEETVTAAVRLSVTSFKHQSVNKDIVYRLLDIYTLHFKKAAGVKNPSFDAN